MGSFDTTTLRDKGGAISTSDKAQRIKEQATALHRAGEYDEAAREFARAAELLEAAGGALAPPPALSAIRLSLAAAQLKVRSSGMLVVRPNLCLISTLLNSTRKITSRFSHVDLLL